MLPIWIPILVAVVGIVLAAAIAFRAGITYRRRTAERAMGSAEEEAKKIVNDAIKNAEQKLKEASVEAKEKAYKGVSRIHWMGMQYRHDIADKGIKHLKDHQ